ncbi:MAG: penicillin-binding transpeptidase domain-containing protein [Thermomicrobiales bacterium]
MRVRERDTIHFKPRKRIEIQRITEKKHPRSPERTPDQLRLSRRTFSFMGLAAASFVALTGRLWQIQVRDHDTAKQQVVVYSQRIFTVAPARGLIYDRDKQLLADNVKSWAVAIVPASLPDDPDEKIAAAKQNAIFTALAQHLSMPDIVVVVPDLLPKDDPTKNEIYTRLAAAIGVPVADVRTPVEHELATAAEKKRAPQSKIKVPINLLGKELAPDKVAAARALAPQVEGVAVVNPIAYLAEVYGTFDPYVPLIVKQGVSKEVALGIEANRLYLPGVQIDDTALKRRYLVGEELGHVMGYTGPISQEQYNAAIQRDERGQPILDEEGDPIPIYLPQDYVGQGGVEAGLEEMLRGQRGHYVAKIDAVGKIVGEYDQYRKNAVDGQNVILTIPLDYQIQVRDILKDGIARVRPYLEDQNKQAIAEAHPERVRPIPPPAGAAVAINPQNGEVLALVSLPSYDPRYFADGISQQQFDIYSEKNIPDKDKTYPLLDRCVGSAFPPGSTLKTFMASAALQEGVVTPDSKTKCLGWIEVPTIYNEYARTNYYCWTRDAQHQDLTVREALATSCDVFFYNVGGPKQKDANNIDTHYYLPSGGDPQWFTGLGIDRINTYLQAFGFGARTNIELPADNKGLVPGIAWKAQNYEGNDQFWSLGDTLNTSIGQGYDLATPLQLCLATSSIANRGTLYKPTLVHQLVDDQGNVLRQPTATVVRKLPIDPAHLDVVRDGMQMNITWHRDNLVKGLVAPEFDPQGNPVPGTEQFRLPQGVTAGVKTGTAEYGTEVDDRGLLLRAHAWCAAFAPFDNPEICVVAFVQGGSASSTIAAPIASGMISAWFDRKASGKA